MATRTKKPATRKKAPAKHKRAVSEELAYRSLRAQRSQTAFWTFKVTRQTVYWTLLAAFIVAMQLLILNAQLNVAQATNELEQQVLAGN